MSLYLLAVIGCDATTEVLLDLPPERYEVLASVVAQVNEVPKYTCMPDVKLAEVTTAWAIIRQGTFCQRVGEPADGCAHRLKPGDRYVNLALVDPDSAGGDMSDAYPTCAACATAAGYAPDGAA